jgi:hypothetical protein
MEKLGSHCFGERFEDYVSGKGNIYRGGYLYDIKIYAIQFALSSQTRRKVSLSYQNIVMYSFVRKEKIKILLIKIKIKKNLRS